MGYPKCPYDTLGVHKQASQEEIKAAFRRLSKEYHPDVAAAADVASSSERFKEISNAASILTNTKNRRLHDANAEAMFRSYADMKVPKRPSAQSTTPNSSMMSSLLRPRNFILGPIALFATVSAVQYIIGSEKEDHRTLENTKLVQAWLNPQSGRYETPAPWDPVYRHLKPDLEYVPRDQVHPRTR